jgi:hypothetical protein
MVPNVTINSGFGPDASAWPAVAKAADGGSVDDRTAFRIPIFDPVDMVHDAPRHLLYVSTDHGEVVRYDLASREVVGRWELGGFPLGMDLSLNGEILLVADRAGESFIMPRRWLYRLDLVDLEARKIALSADGDRSSFSVAFIDDDHALVSPAGLGFGPLWRLSLADEQLETLHDVESNTLLVPSHDRTTIVYSHTERFPSQAAILGRYTSASGTVEALPIEIRDRPWALAVSPAQDQYALAQNGSLAIVDGRLALSATLTMDGKEPVGVAYSPVADLLCVAWVDRGISTPPASAPALESPATIVVYSASTRQRIAALETGAMLLRSGGSTYPSGRLKISQAGDWLFVAANEGVVAYPLAP